MSGDRVIREAGRVLQEAAALLDEDDDVPFQHVLSPPEEFRTPDLSRTKRLDREQEAEGLDTHRRVEDVEPVRGRSRRRR